MKNKIYFLILLLVPCFLFSEGEFSPATEKALLQFERLDREIDYGRSVSESLLRCSFVQDAWLTYLHDAESVDDFLIGMKEINKKTKRFKENLRYAATVVNFFNPGHPRILVPQPVKIDHEWHFHNTYKKGTQLTAGERESYFLEEWSNYQAQKVVSPFDLDKTALLDSGILYNFALLPDGTIRVGEENPGGREYLPGGEAVIDDFAYPNHTILAGSANQTVLSAGALILFRDAEKELLFISNKSGHFVPSYESLHLLRSQMSALGVDPNTIILVPTVDLGDVVLKTYNKAQVPLSLTSEEASQLFSHAQNRWSEALKEIDLNLIEELSKGNLAALTPENTRQLIEIREEATYMRNAYYLYTYNHTAPPLFHKFVKRFGRLKDGIKHNIPEVVQKNAQWIHLFLTENEDYFYYILPIIGTEDDLYDYLTDQVNMMKTLLTKEELSVDEFHTVKKTAREFASLFLDLSDEMKGAGRNYFLYRAAARLLFRVNIQMAAIHDVAVGRIMNGENEEEILLSVPPMLQERLETFLAQLGIAPPTIDIQLQEETVSKLIKRAKKWYEAHAEISGEEPLYPEVREYLQDLSEKNPQAIVILNELQQKSEIAKHALIFLTRSHKAPDVLIRYTEILNHILTSPETATDEAALFLNFMESQDPPTWALEKYHCTDQEGFEKELWNTVSNFKEINAPLISSENARKVKRSLQSVIHLITLYLHIGQKYHTQPTVAYEELLRDCEWIMEELTYLIEVSGQYGIISLSPTLQSNSQKLIKKFSPVDKPLSFNN